MITASAVYSDKVIINAPAEFVWAILTDFPSYIQWNRFCPIILNKGLAVGEKVDMQVDLGKGLQQQVEVIEKIEAPHLIAWGMVLENAETLRALRTQSLKVIDNHCCEYVSVDEFSGSLTQTIIEQSGTAIEKGFNICAYGLKDFAEKCFAQRP